MKLGRRFFDWMCFRIVMAWPGSLPDCRNSHVFGFLLANAGRFASGARHD